MIKSIQFIQKEESTSDNSGKSQSADTDNNL